MTNDETLRRDAEDLARLGYAQQLFREMGGFSNFAVSFSIISVLPGAVLLYGYGLKFAGPIVNTVGWPVVSVFTLAIAASMAELASSYPTAGGLYFWAFRLGGRGWAWTTAWLNMVGQVTITAGINVAAAIYLIGAAARVFGVAKIPSPLFALAPGLAEAYRAAPLGLVFVLAFLQAQWTYTGYDASAHMAEETRMARLNSAWGIFLSVAVSAVVGYVLLVVLTWTIPRGDVAAVASDPYPVLAIADGHLARPAAHLVAIIIGGAMWLCGSSSVSSMARMWFAFARDGGIPGSRWIATVNARTGAPVAAILATSALAVLVSLYAAAFTVLTSASTITLYLAYGIPIYLNLRNRLFRHGEFATRETAPWSLGRKATFINVVAVAWVLFIAIVFALPPNELVLWTTLLFGLFLSVYWRAYARRRFRGPAV